MNYLAQLSEDEVSYICSVIPHKETVYYFKQNPKDFAKIMPGFLPTKRSQEEVSALLFRYRKQPFIDSFIEQHISQWLEEIQEHITQIIDDGADRESALMQTLPFSFFCRQYRSIFQTCRRRAFGRIHYVIKFSNKGNKRDRC